MLPDSPQEQLYLHVVRHCAGSSVHQHVANKLLIELRMRCLYEVLQVGRDADAQGIKQSYRAQALRLHPGAYINAHASMGKH